MTHESARALRRVKLSAMAVSALMLAGIGSLMVLARGKGEDITGIVAPALLVALVSGVVAAVAAVMQKRAETRQ
jgi:drug/metabolite transporter (DMT)-like permease